MKVLTLDVGGPVHVVDHGGDGPPMLLVHGLGGSHVNWRDVAPALTRTHHVYALDLLGFGRTPLGNRHATIGDNQRLVDAVIDQVSGGRPVVLVGNSMGGLISTVEAAKRRSKVAALVLVDPALPRARGGRMLPMVTAAFVTMSMPGIGDALMSRRAQVLGTERVVEAALRFCTVDVSRIDPETRAAHVELALWMQEQDHPNRAFLEASRSLMRWLWDRATMEHFITRITAPTLLVHGDKDRLVALHAARAVAAMRPDWTFHVFEDTGHVPMMERPTEFLDVVGRWLPDATAHRDAAAATQGVAEAATSSR